MIQPARGPNHKWFIAFTTVMGTFIEVLDTSVANVALPHMRGTYAVGTDEVTWVITSYLVANAIILPMAGWLGSYFSRKRVYILCLALFTIASYGSGAAPTLWFLILMRVVQGLVGGAMVPMSQAILLEAFPKEEHGKATALFGIGAVAAPVLGPLVGGWITDNWSWPWIFYINIPVGIIAIFLAFIFIEDPPYLKRPEGKVDYASFLFIAVGLGGLEIMLNRGERLDWFASNFIKLFGLFAALGLALFIWRSLTAEHPLVDLSILKERQFSSSVAIMFSASFAMYGVFIFVPLFVQNLMGYTATWAGVVLSPGGMGTILTIGLAGLMVGKIDTRLLVGAGTLIQAGACFILASSTLQAGLGHFWHVMFIYGMGVGLFFVPLGVAMAQNITPEKMGLATSLFNLMRNEGGSIGIAISSTLLARREQFHHAMLSEHVNALSPAVQGALSKTGDLLFSATGLDPASCASLSAGMIGAEVNRQAYTMAFLDIFIYLGVALLCILPLILLLRGRAKTGAISVH